MRLPDLGHQRRELANARRRATDAYGNKGPYTIARALALRALAGWSVEESSNLGWLDPQMPMRTPMREFVSKRSQTRAEDRLNPAQYRYLLDDKEAFAVVAAEYGLAVARTLAVIDGDGVREPGGVPLGGLRCLYELLAKDPAEGVVIKPVGSGRGEGVRAFVRNRARLLEGQDSYSPADIYRAIVRDGRPHLMQERLVDHPGLQALNRTSALQTCRMMTLVDVSGVHILGATVKLARPDARIDGRIRLGTALGILDAAHGVITELWVAGGGGLGLAPATRSPAGDIDVIGAQLPLWDDVCALTVQASEALSPPLRTFGWDVAITAEGPKLVEGNALWDPVPHRSAGPMLRRLKGA